MAKIETTSRGAQAAGWIVEIEERVADGGETTFDEALRMAGLSGGESLALRAAANRLRKRFRSDEVGLCAIVNAKSGRCSENCSFCSQSIFSKSDIAEYSLMEPEAIAEAARRARAMGATRFGIVTAWKGLNDDANLEKICRAIELVRQAGIQPDASLGIIRDPEVARKLKAAGLTEMNHNIETAESHFDSICTTHTYRDRLETIRILREAGIMICSGGIFGMGETPRQRVELAFALKEVDPEVVPMNFLNPIPGTPLGDRPTLTADEILDIIAMFRFVMPGKELKAAGGREIALGDRQREIFEAGADSLIIGDYLTTKGEAANRDLEMIVSAGLKPPANELETKRKTEGAEYERK